MRRPSSNQVVDARRCGHPAPSWKLARLGLTLLAGTLVFGHAERARAFQEPASGAVSAQTLKTPSGPASVHGLADAPAVGIFTAELVQSVPIELPPGPGEFGPKLGLTYAGELGDGVLGIGWALGELKITRSLRAGVPTYTDADELDLTGLGQNGRLVQDEADANLFWVEGLFHTVRVERAGQHFLITDANGTRYLLGGTSAARQEHDGKVAAWYVEDVENVAGQRLSYRYNNAEGHVYLDRIEWGPELDGGQTAFSAVFEYEARPDAVVKLTTGFADKTSSRLKSIAVRAFRGLLRSYELSYEEEDGETSLPFSRLRSIEQFGTDGTTAMPALSFSYARPGRPQMVTYDAAGWVLNERGVSVADVDGDGMGDLLRLEAGNHEYRKAHDSVYSERGFLSGADDVDLEDSALIDLDGDARAELVRIVDDTWRAYRLDGTRWRSLGEIAGSRGLALSGAGTQLADLNGDGRVDVIRATTGGLLVNFASADGFLPEQALPPISSVDVEVEPGTPGVRFADVNGDQLDDVVWLAPEWMKIFLGRGDGTFVAFNRPPYPWGNQAVDQADLLLGDLNRDGLMDLVRVDAGHVTWYRGDAEGRPTPSFFRQLAPPPGAPSDAVVTLADLNGNGSLDVIWSSAGGLWALDLAGATTAGMLTGVDNGLGMTTNVSYTPSPVLAAAAARSGDPWNVLLPVAVPVPTRVETHFADGTTSRVVEYGVRDGFWDGVERRFGGFLTSRKTTLGATPEATLVEETLYERGAGGERALRGKASSFQKTTGTGSLLEAGRSVWEALPATAPVLSRRAALRKTTGYQYEGVTEPIETRTTYDYDAEVRPTLERWEGRLDMSGDEKIVRRRYVDDAERWVRDKVCEETQLEADDATVKSQVQMRYGSDTELFEVCTRAGNGWLRETEARLLFEGEDRWVLQQQASYDHFGNRIDLYENGLRRSVEYDVYGHFAVAEAVPTSATTDLRWQATWDEVLGQPSTLTGPDGQTRSFEYDALGRLSGVRMNAAGPHVRYAYDWRAPLPRTTTFTCDRAQSECGSNPDGAGWRNVTGFSNGAGEALYTATRVGARWIISDYARRDERGRETVLAEPFYSEALEITGPPAASLLATTSEFDALSRLVRRKFPNGATRQLSYGAFVQTAHDSERSDVRSVVDGLGRVLSTERTTGGVIEGADAKYDAVGRLTSMSMRSASADTLQILGQAEQRFSLDTLGRLRQSVDPDIGMRRYAYDDRSLLVRQENGTGQVAHFDYDLAGRLIREGEGESFDDAGDFLFTYDDPAAAVDPACPVQGQLARAKEPSGEVKFCYDGFGNETTVARTIAPPGAASRSAVEYREFAPSGLLLRLRYDDGLDIPYTYDAAARVVRIGEHWRADGDGDIDAAGRVLREHYGNGAEQAYGYDALGLTNRISLGTPSQTLYDVRVTRNTYGAPIAVDDVDGVGLDHQASYSYDGDARLTDSTLGRDARLFQFRYRYDGLQNMVERSATGPRSLGILTGSYIYGEAGLGSGPRQLTSIETTNQQRITFEYDAAGRQVRDRDSRLVYNVFDQLVRVSPPPSAIDPSSVTLEDLGSPSGGYSQATDINASGVALAWDAEDGSPYPGQFPTTAFMWGEGFSPLPQPGSSMFPSAINDSGDVTGIAGRSEGEWQLAFRYVEGAVEFLTYDGAVFAGSGYDINNARQITGYGYFAGYPNGIQWFRAQPNGAVEVLGGLTGPDMAGSSVGAGIDDEGEMVGVSYKTDGSATATLFTDLGGFQDLNQIVPTDASWQLAGGAAINSGFIVGNGEHDGKHRAFRYDRSSGRLVDLGIFSQSRGQWTNPDEAYVLAADVNRYGDVVGAVFDAWPFWPQFAFLYSDALGLVDLNDLVPPEWTLNLASGINDDGEIAGWATHDGQRRAFKMKLGIPHGAGGRTSGAIDYLYGYDGAKTASVSDGDATYWFSPTLQEHAGRREHYIAVGERLVARLTLDAPPASSGTAPPTLRDVTPGAARPWLAALSLLALALARVVRVARRKAQLGQSGWRRSALALSVAAVCASVIGCQMLEAETTSQGLWSLSGAQYLHQGVNAGPTLITNAVGALLEERRYEPFGDPVDALREGDVGSPNFVQESYNSLNKQTDTRTGFSDHGARWMAPQTARWLSPDPVVKASDPQLMLEPWQAHPYQYAGQNPMMFWDPDGAEPVAVTTTYLRKLAGARRIFNKSDAPIVQNRKVGAAFEALAIKLDPAGAKRNTQNIVSASRFLATNGEIGRMRPDAMTDHFGIYQFGSAPYPANLIPFPSFTGSGYFLEAKAERGTLFLSSHDYQIQGLLDIAARRTALSGPTGVAAVVFYTTADTIISQEVLNYAKLVGVTVAQRTLQFDWLTGKFNFTGEAILTPKIWKDGREVEVFQGTLELMQDTSWDELESGTIEPNDPDPTDLN